MDNNSMDKKAIAKEALKALSEIEDELKLEHILGNNSIEFHVDEQLYRVRKPITAEKDFILEQKRKKYLEFIQDPTYLFKKQWIEKYKEKGIDIRALETKIAALQSNIKDLLLRLAKETNPAEIQHLKDLILSDKNEQYNISMEITDLLYYSIEDRLLVYINAYTTYLVLEKQVADNWEKVYTSFDTFILAEDKVISQALLLINYLIYNYEQ